ncbi:hypothetical protein [Brevundimonas variabilis]|nr:hypothetical protein [Brevundimonas variabilis]
MTRKLYRTEPEPKAAKQGVEQQGPIDLCAWSGRRESNPHEKLGKLDASQ